MQVGGVEGVEARVSLRPRLGRHGVHELDLERVARAGEERGADELVVVVAEIDRVTADVVRRVQTVRVAMSVFVVGSDLISSGSTKLVADFGARSSRWVW